MENKILRLFCILCLMQSCQSAFEVYLPGFDFKLFKDTPVWKLARAVKVQDVQEVNEILKSKSINVDFKEPKFGHTLLTLAVANNKVKSVEALLKNGANPNLTSRGDEDNPISIAAEDYSGGCDTIVLHLLIKYGGNINFVQKIDRVEDNGMHSMINRTTLMIAARNDCYAITKYLIDKRAKINEYTYYEGYGAITEAIIQNNLKIVKYLIIDKHAEVPPIIFKRRADISHKGQPEQYLTITDLLNEAKYEKGSENYRLREEIIAYLKSRNLK